MIKRNLPIKKAIELTRKNPTKNRRPENRTLNYMKNEKYEGWNNCDGRGHRYKEIYKEQLNDRPINFLLEKLKIHNPKVMVLGPGKGIDSALFKLELEELGVNIQLDTLGYSKTVEPELIKKKIINKDYSPPISKALAFEHINPIEHPKLAKAIFGKYNLIISERSVGVYNNSNSYALFQSSLLLAKKGRAYIDLQYTKSLNSTLLIAKRMVNAYNKKNNLNLEFAFQEIKETTGRNSNGMYTYIQIDRIK